MKMHKYFRNVGFRVFIVFFIIGSFYILFSDMILGKLYTDIRKITGIQTAKGLLFIITTGIIMAYVVNREVNKKLSFLKQLHKEHKLYDTLVGNLPDTDVYIIDQHYKYIYASGKEMQKHHFDTEELINRTIDQLRLSREWKKKFKFFYSKGLNGERIKEDILFNKLWYEMNIIPLRDFRSYGDVIMVLFTNIHSRKLREQEKEQEGERWRRAEEIAGFGYWQYYPDGGRLVVSEGAKRIYGLKDSPGSLKRSDITHIPLKKYREKLDLAMKKLLAGEGNYDEIFQIKHQDTGELRYIHSMAILNADNIVDGVIHDITKEVEQEAEIIKNRNVLSKTLDSLKDVVIVVDPDTRSIVNVNSAIHEVFGYTKEEILGKGTKVMHIDENHYLRFGEIGNPVLEEKGIFDTEFQMKKKDGSIIDTYNVVRAIDLSGDYKKGVVSIIRDITELNKSQESIKQYQKDLKKLTTQLVLTEERQRREIAENIHDHLSQSLILAKMKLDEFMEQERSEKEQLTVVGDYIKEAVTNSRELTYDLSPPILYKLGLIPAIRWLLDKVNQKSDLSAELRTNARLLHISDEAMVLIYRSINELVSNVLKHAKAKILLLDIQDVEDEIILTVKDDGIGFDSTQLPDRRIEEKGFGLFSIQERIEYLDGTLHLESVQGMGTTIKIIIPKAIKNEN